MNKVFTVGAGALALVLLASGCQEDRTVEVTPSPTVAAPTATASTPAPAPSPATATPTAPTKVPVPTTSPSNLPAMVGQVTVNGAENISANVDADDDTAVPCTAVGAFKDIRKGAKATVVDAAGAPVVQGTLAAGVVAAVENTGPRGAPQAAACNFNVEVDGFLRGPNYVVKVGTHQVNVMNGGVGSQDFGDNGDLTVMLGPIDTN